MLNECLPWFSSSYSSSPCSQEQLWPRPSWEKAMPVTTTLPRKLIQFPSNKATWMRNQCKHRRIPRQKTYLLRPHLHRKLWSHPRRKPKRISKLNDGLLNLLWGIVLGEVLSQLTSLEGDTLFVSLFDFVQDINGVLRSALADSTQLLQPLRLRQRGGVLGIAHGIQDNSLLVWFQERELNSRVHTDLFCVDHFKQFWN